MNPTPRHLLLPAALFLLLNIFPLPSPAQSHPVSGLIMDAGGERLGDTDQLRSERIDQRSIAWEDPTLRTGRELKQGEAIIVVKPPPSPAPTLREQNRIRAMEDRARIKRVVASE